MKHMTLQVQCDIPISNMASCHVAWDKTIMSGTWHLRPCPRPWTSQGQPYDIECAT